MHEYGDLAMGRSVAAPAPTRAPAAAEPTGAVSPQVRGRRPPSGEKKQHLHWYGPEDPVAYPELDQLTEMRNEVYHVAALEGQTLVKHDASAAFIRAILRHFPMLQREAVADLLGRPIDRDEAIERARQVERGEAPSGSVVLKVTGPNSLSARAEQ